MRTPPAVLTGTGSGVVRLWPWAGWFAALALATAAMVLVRRS